MVFDHLQHPGISNAPQDPGIIGPIAELRVQHGTTGSLTVDDRTSKHVRGRSVRFATLAANRWHRLSGRLQHGAHRTTVAVAFLTHG